MVEGTAIGRHQDIGSMTYGSVEVVGSWHWIPNESEWLGRVSRLKSPYGIEQWCGVCSCEWQYSEKNVKRNQFVRSNAKGLILEQPAYFQIVTHSSIELHKSLIKESA